MREQAFVPPLGKQRQLDLFEFETGLIYIVNFRTDRVMQRDLVSKVF